VSTHKPSKESASSQDGIQALKVYEYSTEFPSNL
jgi:hypothetical protein